MDHYRSIVKKIKHVYVKCVFSRLGPESLLITRFAAEGPEFVLDCSRCLSAERLCNIIKGQDAVYSKEAMVLGRCLKIDHAIRWYKRFSEVCSAMISDAVRRLALIYGESLRNTWLCNNL